MAGEKDMALLNAVIDLSHYDSVTSFQEAKDSGILGIVHKATQGTEFVDKKYHERRSDALAAGLCWGAYHFGINGDVQGQVNHFLDIVKPAPTDLLVLDFECNPEGGTMTLAEAESFVERLHSQTGRFPGLYTSQDFIKEHLGDRTDSILKNCFLWIARYSSQYPQLPAAFQTFSFWQYIKGEARSQPDQVPGIGCCDRNKFLGDEVGLRKLWALP